MGCIFGAMVIVGIWGITIIMKEESTSLRLRLKLKLRLSLSMMIIIYGCDSDNKLHGHGFGTDGIFSIIKNGLTK